VRAKQHRFEMQPAQLERRNSTSQAFDQSSDSEFIKPFSQRGVLSRVKPQCQRVDIGVAGTKRLEDRWHDLGDKMGRTRTTVVKRGHRIKPYSTQYACSGRTERHRRLLSARASGARRSM
jgi:hypothetical protein